MTVGERLKEVRERLGCSQVDFAERLGVSKQLLYKYENNIITNIPSDKIELAAKITNVSPAYLMGWEEEEPTTIAAHLNIDDLSQDELDDVANYIEFIRSKRNNKE